MNYSISSHIPKALPSLYLSQSTRTLLSASTKHTHSCTAKLNHKNLPSIIQKPIEYLKLKNSILGVQVGAILATVGQPALAVTGVNYEEDLTSTLIQLGVVAFFYFLVAPPIIMNWLRIRWYRRNLLEMYFQFMFVFIFFAGIILWAPFLNFRKFPRDPSMKYPWSKPEDPSKIKNSYLKYPLTNSDLPEEESEFFDLLHTYFPCIYDIKYLMKSCDALKGGLQQLAADLNVQRIGPAHQAGSDSLLTSATFFKMMQVYFENNLNDNKYIGVLYGLGQGYDNASNISHGGMTPQLTSGTNSGMLVNKYSTDVANGSTDRTASYYYPPQL